MLSKLTGGLTGRVCLIIGWAFIRLLLVGFVNRDDTWSNVIFNVGQKSGKDDLGNGVSRTSRYLGCFDTCSHLLLVPFHHLKNALTSRFTTIFSHIGSSWQRSWRFSETSRNLRWYCSVARNASPPTCAGGAGKLVCWDLLRKPDDHLTEVLIMVKGKGRRTLHLVRQLSFPIILRPFTYLLTRICQLIKEWVNSLFLAWSTRAAPEQRCDEW